MTGVFYMTSVIIDAYDGLVYWITILLSLYMLENKW